VLVIDTTFNHTATEARHKNISPNTYTYICPPSPFPQPPPTPNFLTRNSVLRACPVRELATEDGAVNVEMDPEDEWRVRQELAGRGLR
jgi:hypothetical protein